VVTGFAWPQLDLCGQRTHHSIRAADKRRMNGNGISSDADWFRLVCTLPWPTISAGPEHILYAVSVGAHQQFYGSQGLRKSTACSPAPALLLAAVLGFTR
jgi:hypothetical protein